MISVDFQLTPRQRLAREAAAAELAVQVAVFCMHRRDHWVLLRGEDTVTRVVDSADALLAEWAATGLHGIRHCDRRRGIWVVLRVAAPGDDAEAWGGSVAYHFSASAPFRELTRGQNLLSLALSTGVVGAGDDVEQSVERLVADTLASLDLGNRRGDDLGSVEQLLRAGSLTNVVQPIARLDGSGIFGYEVLTRGPRGHALESPLRLFEAVVGTFLAPPLEAAAIDAAMRRGAELQPGQRIFVNLDPVIASDPRFIDHLGQAAASSGVRPDQVVIELIERSALNGLGSFAETIQRYRREGYTIAIDDVGAAHSSLQRILSLHPHIIKIDRDLISGCGGDERKRAMLGFLAQLAWSMDAQVVAEGVETEEELDVVRSLGMDLIQGYLIARPTPAMAPLSEAAQRLLSAPMGA